MLHRGLEVWIAYANGERIPEYEVQVDAEDKRKMTCTIPSDAGKASRSTSTAHVSLANLSIFTHLVDRGSWSAGSTTAVSTGWA